MKALLYTLMGVALGAGCTYGAFRTYAAPSACAAAWEAAGYEVRYSTASGCRVRVEGRWITERQLRFKR